MNCLNCGKATTNPKYCSKTCSKPVKERICNNCGGIWALPQRIYRSQRGWCPNCANKEEVGKTIGDLRRSLAVSGKHPSWKHSAVRLHARYLHAEELQNAVCEICQFTHAELCHIKPVSEFPDSAFLTEVNISVS